MDTIHRHEVARQAHDVEMYYVGEEKRTHMYEAQWISRTLEATCTTGVFLYMSPFVAQICYKVLCSQRYESLQRVRELNETEKAASSARIRGETRRLGNFTNDAHQQISPLQLMHLTLPYICQRVLVQAEKVMSLT